MKVIEEKIRKKHKKVVSPGMSVRGKEEFVENGRKRRVKNRAR